MKDCIGRSAAFAIVLCAATACGANELPSSHVANDHKISVGDSIAPLALTCAGGATRVVADPAKVQLVTVSTASDCSTCLSHLAGLENILEHDPIHIETFYVSWVPPEQQRGAMIAYHTVTTRLVCFDERGVLWDKYNVSHTPVTVLLRHGRIVYMHDMPLISEPSQQTFLADLRRLGVR